MKIGQLIQSGLDGEHDAEAAPYIEKTANTFLIGAAKSGTTSLHYLIKRHPEVCASGPKEPKFYCRDYHRGWEWYANCFAPKGDETIFVDSSTRYSLGTQDASKTPELIAHYRPDAKIVYMVRDPLAKFISQIKHIAGRPRSKLTSDEALTKNLKMLVYSTRYMDRAQDYETLFPNRVLVLQFEDMLKNTDANLKKLTDFLEIAPFPEGTLLPIKNAAVDSVRKAVSTPDMSDAKVQKRLREIVQNARLLCRAYGLDETNWPSLTKDQAKS